MPLPEPYYQTELGTLYCGDCLEIMPHLPKVDLVLTDPPYPGLVGGVKFFGKGVAKVRNESFSVGEIWDMDLRWVPLTSKLATKGILIFCSYHFVEDLPIIIGEKKACLVTWYKRNTPLPVNNVPRFTTEFVWCFRKAPGLNWKKIETMVDIPLLPGGCIGKERIKTLDGKTAHPTQKPIKLISYLLGIGGGLVLDPFLGSGTTSIACERLGRRWIGIEISEEYCEIAKQRIEKETSQLKLFPVSKPEPPEQENMF